MNVLFFGTPQIAVPFLEWLHKNHDVVGVVCKPDEPLGRGYKLTPPQTKVFALINRIPLFQPEGRWTEDTIKALNELGADVGLAIAYGRIVPESVYNAPRLGTVNIHFSMLPKYRGAGPVQWSLINGEERTGVTAFWLEKEMDSGPVFHRKAVKIDSEDNAKTLWRKLVPAGIDIMVDVMRDLGEGKVIKEPQKGEVTLAPQLTKETGRIDWSRPAKEIVNLIRGVYEWPGAATSFTGPDGRTRPLKIYKARVAPTGARHGAWGQIIDLKNGEGFVVRTGTGALLVLEVKPGSKKMMSAWAFWQGARLRVGDSLG